ncbi:hypothetical protein [Pseudomonas sp.]|uniref:hypothetical protein n=1 Tax=Pseudomonas sp. TaxID=306 RepID=UPI00356421B2
MDCNKARGLWSRTCTGQASGERCSRRWIAGCGALLQLIGFAQLIAMRINNVRIPMEHALSFATWFWLIVPMGGIVLLSLVTYLMGK